MEIVILPDDQAIGSLGADAFENLLASDCPPTTRRATGTSSTRTSSPGSTSQDIQAAWSRVR